MYHFIINPNSCSGMGRIIWNGLRRELLLRGVVFRSYLTRYAGHAVRLAREVSSLASPEDPAVLVAVGGDGTICEVFSGISDPACVLFGYIPAGSGNDFCRGMQLPRDPMAALDSILKQERLINMDLPCIRQSGRTHRFGISTGMGYDAAVCQELLASPLKRIFNRLHLGRLVYLFVALKKLLLMQPASVSMCLDGIRKYHYDRVYFTAVMNLKYEGGGFMFCPAAKPDDGWLDVIVVEGVGKLKILFFLPAAFWGGLTGIRGIHIFRCRSIDIHSGVPLPVHRDGEAGGITDHISVAVEKKSLKVIMPAL